MEIKTMQIKAKAPKVSREGEVSYVIGETLAENVELFGEDLVNKIFIEQLIVKVQSGVRKCLETENDPQTWADGYKPGTKMPSAAKDPKTAARMAISKMSAEERMELIAQLQQGI
jgi:hypothetical protein